MGNGDGPISIVGDGVIIPDVLEYSDVNVGIIGVGAIGGIVIENLADSPHLTGVNFASNQVVKNLTEAVNTEVGPIFAGASNSHIQPGITINHVVANAAHDGVAAIATEEDLIF